MTVAEAPTEARSIALSDASDPYLAIMRILSPDASFTAEQRRLSLVALLMAYYSVLGGRVTGDAKPFIEVGSRALTTVFTELFAQPMSETLPFWQRWNYIGGDQCAKFFTACLKAAKPHLPPHPTILEIGSAEFNFLGELYRLCPELQTAGIDWRASDRGVQADVLTYNFPRESFDCIVSISAIEHIGLGHYSNGDALDPIDPDGDTHAMAQAWRWLKPGGWLYVDVPYNPEQYRVVETSHREYDSLAWNERIINQSLRLANARADVLFVGFANHQTADVLTARPVEVGTDVTYIGAWLRKRA